jgi:hypothetical protein
MRKGAGGSRGRGRKRGKRKERGKKQDPAWTYIASYLSSANKEGVATEKIIYIICFTSCAMEHMATICG